MVSSVVQKQISFFVSVIVLLLYMSEKKNAPFGSRKPKGARGQHTPAKVAGVLKFKFGCWNISNVKPLNYAENYSAFYYGFRLPNGKLLL